MTEQQKIEAQKLAQELAAFTATRAIEKARHTVVCEWPEMKKTFKYKKDGAL